MERAALCGLLTLAASLSLGQEKGLVFAHRGGAKEFDENTLAAFRGSYEKGLRGFETYCKKLHDTVMAARPEGSFYVFTSFDQRPLKIMKRLDPQSDILLISGGACSNEFVQAALKLGAKRVGCRVDLTSRAQVRAAQKAGLRVSCWPGHTVEDYELGMALGVDALCTDIPVKVMEWKSRAP